MSGRLTRTAVALAVALLAVTARPAPAAAATALGDGDVLIARTAQDYTYRTYARNFSVVAVQPAATADWDLALRDGSGATVASSVYGTGRTDFVAVDSTAGHRPLGAYTATVTQYRAGVYWAQQRTAPSVITLPPVTHAGVTGAGDPDLAFAVLAGDDIVTVSDIYLSAGESFWAHTTSAASSLFLVHSDPGVPATYAQGRATAAARQHTQVLDGCTLYTAQSTGWQALVYVGDRAPKTTDPPQGTALALHRVDPAHPARCPQRNFPAPTP